MSKEIWVDVPNYEGKYQISSEGVVKLKAREILDNDGRILTAIPETIVEVRNTEHDPYPHVVLHDGHQYHREKIDTLLQKAFSTE